MMRLSAQLIADLLGDDQRMHTPAQMDYFITLKNGVTKYGCYRQALREVRKRYMALRGMYTERDLKGVEIARLSRTNKTVVSEDELDRMEREIRLGQARFDLLEIERSIRDVMRELAHFTGQALGLKRQLGELTPERRRALDAEEWRAKGLDIRGLPWTPVEIEIDPDGSRAIETTLKSLECEGRRP